MAEVGRVAHAARQLDISQSTVTTAVGDLIDLLGETAQVGIYRRTSAADRS